MRAYKVELDVAVIPDTVNPVVIGDGVGARAEIVQVKEAGQGFPLQVGA